MDGLREVATRYGLMISLVFVVFILIIAVTARTGYITTALTEQQSLQIITISANPPSPMAGQPVTFTATAHDNVPLSRINIYMDGVLKNTCRLSDKSGTCVYTTTFPAAGSHTYYATASHLSDAMTLQVRSRQH